MFSQARILNATIVGASLSFFGFILNGCTAPQATPLASLEAVAQNSHEHAPPPSHSQAEPVRQVTVDISPASESSKIMEQPQTAPISGAVEKVDMPAWPGKYDPDTFDFDAPSNGQLCSQLGASELMGLETATVEERFKKSGRVQECQDECFRFLPSFQAWETADAMVTPGMLVRDLLDDGFLIGYPAQ